MTAADQSVPAFDLGRLDRAFLDDPFPIYRALREAAGQLRRGEPSAAVQRRARTFIARQPSARVDYLTVADADTLRPVAHPKGRVVVLAAVRIGATRLIDNILVDVP